MKFMIRNNLIGFLAAAIIVLSGPVQGSVTGPEGQSVLIYTRNGEGYVHDNIAASVEALEEICADLGITTVVSDDPLVFESPALKDYDAIIFSNSNNEAFLKDIQRKNFQDYVLSGKAFMAIHSANASERDWPWYANMLGGKFVRHSPLQPFDIKVIDPEHPSTEHLPGTWAWEDECYYSNQLNPAIHVLLAVDLSTIEDPKKEDLPGDIFGELFPLAWCHEFEGTKVFYTALGHKISYYKDENFRKHLRGGILWILSE
jgi:type 1 glutamine amidotransferase